MATTQRAVPITVTWAEPDSSLDQHGIFFRVRLRTKDENGNWQWRYNSGLLNEYSDGGGTGWSATPTVEYEDTPGADIACYVDIYEAQVVESAVTYRINHPAVFEKITANSNEDFTPYLDDWSVQTEV